MNFILFRLAVRNVLKQKRRTFFNVLALGINTAMIILLLGILRGSYWLMIERTIDLRTGHIQVHAEGYEAEKRRLPLDIAIDDASRLARRIEDLPEVKAASPRIRAAATLSNGRYRAPVFVMAVEPDAEAKVGVIQNSVIEGEWLDSLQPGIIVGKKMVDLLGAELGESLLLYARTSQGANNLIDVPVRGIFSTGFSEMDRMAVFVPLQFGWEFFDMPGEATEIVIRLHRTLGASKVVPRVKDILAKSTNQKLQVASWQYFAQDVVQGAKADLIFYAILFVILVSLAVFGITNTMTVSVFERVPEIGALRALGMERQGVHRMLLLEGFVLGLGGIVAGSILGGLLAWWMNTKGISISTEALEQVAIPMGDKFLAASRFVDWIIGGGLAMISALIGVLWPARRAARVPVTAALARGVR
jgi:putative ABC transport system permease protein